MPSDSSFAERHYRVGELAELWHIGRETVRKIVMWEPGVIKIGLETKKVTRHIPSLSRLHAGFIRASKILSASLRA